ncbi:HEPN domain-containing protein [Agromyces sp. NPDC056523]|uniref:ApeA N-terminal domain 1-containing protein n=1 Tax=Agromyces sp. NPDC056523 TaxID=3345850 RepID=UPI003673469D
MSAMEWHGHWWLPEAPEDKVPGRLVVEPDGESRLELIGGFDLVIRESPGAGMFRRVPVILGHALGKPATLLDCFTLTTRGGFFSRPQFFHRLHVHRVLIGAHVGQTEPAFRSARVQIENLTNWLAFPAANRTSDLRETTYVASVRAIEPLSVAVDGWTIQARSHAQPFQLTQTREQDVVSSEITAYLFLIPDSPTSANGFDELILQIMDLVTLASGEPSGLISATLFHTDRREHPNADGSTSELPIEVESYGRRIHTAEPEAAAVPFHQFRFTCDDLPFDQLIADWMRIRSKASTACNVYFGLQYSRPGFTETRLLMNAIASEALHSSLYGDATSMSKEHFASLRSKVLAALDDEDDRRWVKANLRNGPSLRERLRALASVPDGSAVKALIDDIEVWARRLVLARNGLAHTGSEDGDGDIFRLEWVTSGLLALVLMAELDLPGEIQKRAAINLLSLPG